MIHHEHIDPVTQRHRRWFAALRICEVSLAVLGVSAAMLALSAPASPGQTTRELYFIAWSTPRVFVAAGAALIAVAALLQLVSRPLKRRWARHLRGWIT
jgi:hypothetical protein